MTRLQKTKEADNDNFGEMKVREQEENTKGIEKIKVDREEDWIEMHKTYISCKVVCSKNTNMEKVG